MAVYQGGDFDFLPAVGTYFFSMVQPILDAKLAVELRAVGTDVGLCSFVSTDQASQDVYEWYLLFVSLVRLNETVGVLEDHARPNDRLLLTTNQRFIPSLSSILHTFNHSTKLQISPWKLFKCFLFSIILNPLLRLEYILFSIVSQLCAIVANKYFLAHYCFIFALSIPISHSLHIPWLLFHLVLTLSNLNDRPIIRICEVFARECWSKLFLCDRVFFSILIYLTHEILFVPLVLFNLQFYLSQFLN